MYNFTKDDIYILELIKLRDDGKDLSLCWGWGYVYDDKQGLFESMKLKNMDKSSFKKIIIRFCDEKYIKVINDKVQVTQKGIELCNKPYPKNS